MFAKSPIPKIMEKKLGLSPSKGSSSPLASFAPLSPSSPSPSSPFSLSSSSVVKKATIAEAEEVSPLVVRKKTKPTMAGVKKRSSSKKGKSKKKKKEVVTTASNLVENSDPDRTFSLSLSLYLSRLLPPSLCLFLPHIVFIFGPFLNLSLAHFPSHSPPIALLPNQAVSSPIGLWSCSVWMILVLQW